MGLIFFGTPFRGTDELTIGKMLQLAEQEFGKDQVLETALRTSVEADETLVGLVDQYLQVARQSERPRVACFYEQRPTNVASIVNKNVRGHDSCRHFG